jgi:hypothetical protein
MLNMPVLVEIIALATGGGTSLQGAILLKRLFHWPLMIILGALFFA